MAEREQRRGGRGGGFQNKGRPKASSATCLHKPIPCPSPSPCPALLYPAPSSTHPRTLPIAAHLSVPDEGLHLHQVNQTAEALLLANGQVDDQRVGTQVGDDLRQRRAGHDQGQHTNTQVAHASASRARCTKMRDILKPWVAYVLPETHAHEHTHAEPAAQRQQQQLISIARSRSMALRLAACGAQHAAAGDPPCRGCGRSWPPCGPSCSQSRCGARRTCLPAATQSQTEAPHPPQSQTRPQLRPALAAHAPPARRDKGRSAARRDDAGKGLLRPGRAGTRALPPVKVPDCCTLPLCCRFRSLTGWEAG